MGKASKADKPLTPGSGRQRRAANAAAADAATLPPHPKSGSDPTLKWLNGLPMIVLLWQTLRTGMNSDAEDPWRHAMWVGTVMYLIVASGSVATRHFNISKGRLHTSHRPIVLFDGGCVMCNGFASFCIARDPREVLSFASLQSDAGQLLLKEHGLPPDPQTFVLIEDGVAYVRSDASLKTLTILKPSLLWAWMYLFEPLPYFMRDSVYDLGWALRRRLFGTRACMRIPSSRIVTITAAAAGRAKTDSQWGRKRGD